MISLVINLFVENPMKSSKAVYDTIGKSYDNTRNPDPVITKTLLELLCLDKKGRYLDIGCGSGNYTGALASMGLSIEGVDLSLEMLNKARKKYPQVLFHHGDAKKLAFPDNIFDGVVCILATHHIGDNLATFQSAYRVMKAGRLVLFTATPEQMQHYWLCHYFPQMMKNSAVMMSSFSELQLALTTAGFHTVQKIPFLVSNQLQDWFLHAGKYRPEIYLDQNVRDGISSFHLFSKPDELTTGLKQLKNDIDSGDIHKIIENYATDQGDYLFVTAEKNAL